MMRTFHDYRELSENIHAPRELKQRVLWAAQQQSSSREKMTGKYVRRGLSLVQKAAAAAILVLVLPVTAYAAVAGFGLMDYLKQSGMKDTQPAMKLSSDLVEQTPYSNNFAEYTVTEATCDSNTIYLAAKITPLDNSYLLVPQFISDDNLLEVDGEVVGTLSEYAAVQGKTVVYADIGYHSGEEHLDGSVDFRCSGDGTLYYYVSAANIFQGRKDIVLKCSGVAYTEEMSVADRVEFEVGLLDKSTASALPVYTIFSPEAYADTGIRINSLTLEETEMGLYATFNFTTTEAKFQDIVFKLVDSEGTELAYLPGEMGTGTIDNGDGTFSRTNNYQKPSSMEGVKIVIRDFVSAVNYGPYSFE